MDAPATSFEYLVRSQLPDGSWGSGDPFTCSRALLALKDRMPDDTLIRGLNYLEGMQEPDGHFGRKTGMYSDASNTAYTMIVLNKFDYGKASLPISKGIMWLLENQQEDGSWGPNTRKKAFTTTLCLRALHTFYLSGIQRFARGLDFSLNYLENLKFEEEPVSHVYAPVLNLKRVGYLDDALRHKFIAYALNASSDSIAQGQVADVAMLLGTLRALDEHEISSLVEVWLLATQNDDGGFGKTLGTASDVATTALVILAMTNLL